MAKLLFFFDMCNMCERENLGESSLFVKFKEFINKLSELNGFKSPLSLINSFNSLNLLIFWCFWLFERLKMSDKW